MIKINSGATRFVYLFKRIVIKLPRWSSYTDFLLGLISNYNEVKIWKTRHKNNCSDKLAPILFYLPFGLLIIMKKAIMLNNFNAKEFSYKLYPDNYTIEYYFPVENKIDSFGIINNKIVAIDYN